MNTFSRKNSNNSDDKEKEKDLEEEIGMDVLNKGKEGDDDGETLKDDLCGNENDSAPSPGKKHDSKKGTPGKKTTFQLSALSKQAGAAISGPGLEQSMPADAVLAKEGADEVCSIFFFFLERIDN
jgi:hypothetical protein